MNHCSPEILRLKRSASKVPTGGKHIKVEELTRHIPTMRLHVDDYRSDSFQPEPEMANSLCLDEAGKPQEASPQNQFATDFNSNRPRHAPKPGLGLRLDWIKRNHSSVDLQH